MKVIIWEELKTKTSEAPFYGVLKSREDRTRALGCGPLAFLNLVLILKRRLGIFDGKTAHDVVFQILNYVEESQNLSISFQSAMDFLDRFPFFDGFRMLLLNPNGMVPEVFLQIALRRLERGEAALMIVEAPDPGKKPQGQANHLAVVHSENGDVFLDGLKIDLEAFINIAYFSHVNSLLFFYEKYGGEIMSREYLGHYERMCLEATAAEIRQAYPRISAKQIKHDIELMKAMNAEWEKAKFRRFLQKIRHLIYRD